MLVFFVVVAMASARRASDTETIGPIVVYDVVLGRSRDRPRVARQPVGHAVAVRHDRPSGRLRRATQGDRLLVRTLRPGGDGRRRSCSSGSSGWSWSGPVRVDPRPPRAADHGLHADPDRRDAPLRTADLARERGGVRRLLRAHRGDGAAHARRERTGRAPAVPLRASRRSHLEPGLLAVIMVALGSTTFDGFSRVDPLDDATARARPGSRGSRPSPPGSSP